MKATNVYEKVRKDIKSGARIVRAQGGSRSSKTYSIFQNLLNLAIESPVPFKVTIGRKTLQAIKSTLLPDFRDITTQYREETGFKVTPEVNIRRQDQIYYFNGCEFGFYGMDNPEKIHGLKQHIVWLNEAMEIQRDSFDQLEMRTEWFLILDYNPYDDQHWVFDLDLRPDIATNYSTVLDNPFVPYAIRAKIMGYEPTEENYARGTANPYMWDVYGLGLKGRLEGVIYENWDTVESIPGHANFIGLGLDFGYTNDPTGLVEFWMADNEIYLNELLYEPGLTNDDIARKMRNNFGINNTMSIIADSSEPKSIEEIYRHGFNIKGVEKGQDSVNFGIDILKGYKMHITRNSTNLDTELRKYIWDKDRNGKLLNKPVDEFNHLLDAVRYVAMTHLKKKVEFKSYASLPGL